MKHLALKAIVFISLSALFATTSFAQVTATATASATVVTSIAISKTVDMNFGNLVGSASLGTIVLTPTGSRSVTGGVSLPAIGGTVTAASFSITGDGVQTFAITLPVSCTITKVASTETMIVNAFTSVPSGTGILTAGAQTLIVGATLNVGASQVAGIYTSIIPFDVTVNYN